MRARKEVVLSAGALNTPKLLQLSGIGPSDVISRLGLTVRAHLQGVGNNLRDHYGVRMVQHLTGVRTFNTMAQGLPLGLEVAKWLIGRPSVCPLALRLCISFGNPQRH